MEVRRRARPLALLFVKTCPLSVIISVKLYKQLAPFSKASRLFIAPILSFNKNKPNIILKLVQQDCLENCPL